MQLVKMVSLHLGAGVVALVGTEDPQGAALHMGVTEALHAEVGETAVRHPGLTEADLLTIAHMLDPGVEDGSFQTRMSSFGLLQMKSSNMLVVDKQQRGVHESTLH
jgi:hypothetical protein